MKKSTFLLFLTLGFFTLNAQTYDTVWLSSLDLSHASLGWGIRGVNKSCMGNPIILNGITYKYGFGTHANSILRLKLNNGSARFHAIVGIDDEEKASTGSVEFTVYSNKEQLWKSSKLVSGGKSETIDISMRGIDTLVLTASGTLDGISFDHADWADAYFLVKADKPFTIARPLEKAEILTPKPRETPKINGPKIYGARPGNDFLYKLPVTGKRPIEYTITGLPEGLVLNTKTGIISGKTTKEGRFETYVTAKNEFGENQRTFIIVIGDKIALTPPLGWNSWNCFACAVTGSKVKDAADAMISSGLADHGWSYINIDDCWMGKPNSNDSLVGGLVRDVNGNYIANSKFPDIKGLTDYIHSLGLKAGIYSGPGPKTCAGYEGCYQHEEQDAAHFAAWGFDYLKYDWCDYESIAKDHSLPELKKPYLVMKDALTKANRDIVYSLCQYGMGNAWEWGAEVGGNCWRTTGDIYDDWSSVESIGFSQSGKEKYAGPGRWNDPDMLVVGKVGWGPDLHQTNLSPNEQYSHISLWALLASPLLIGCDMTQLDEFTLNLLTNDEVLDINQDILGKQASRTAVYNDIEIWTKELEDGSMALGIFNRGMFASKAVLKFSELKLPVQAQLRDVWRQKDLGQFLERYETTIPSHGVQLLKISKP